MGRQAALTLNRARISAAEPLPMAKLAVEDVCNREMAKVSAVAGRRGRVFPCSFPPPPSPCFSSPFSFVRSFVRSFFFFFLDF